MALSPCGNQSAVPTTFLLLGLPGLWETRLGLCALFLLLYLLTLVSNLLLLAVVWVDTHLHVPMYLLLCALATSETCLSLAVVPQMLVALASLHGTAILSYQGCKAQMLLSGGWACTNCFLLAAMGYDRAVAVSDPLRYTTRMGHHVCICLVVGCWLGGFIVAGGMCGAIFWMSYCPGQNPLNHFFCDIPPLLAAAQGVTAPSEAAVLLLSLLVLGGSVVAIVASYGSILVAVLKVHGGRSWHRAFATCGAHLTVVVLHFGCASFIYLRPKDSYTLERDCLLSITYAVVTPFLNPLVYSLRNREVHTALHKLLVQRRVEG